MWPQFTNMLGFWGWALLAAVPAAIVALYFLKLKRKPLEVPSTYLWRRSIEDLHVNALWQKLRQNVLLLLQLAAVALVALAVLRPAWRGTKLVGDRFIFIVDNSASMSAGDLAPSRLEAAKAQALALIDDMQSGDVGMVISFHRAARVEQSFTPSRRDLRRAVQNIRPTVLGTSLQQALRLAAGLANPDRASDPESNLPAADPLPATVYLFTDGRFDDVPSFSLEHLELKFIPVGTVEAANVGILSFNTQRQDQPPHDLQAFARLANFGPRAARPRVELYLLADDGSRTLIDAQQVELAAGKTRGVAFGLGDLDTGGLELRIPRSADGPLADGSPDVLPLDDAAWTVIDPGRRAQVLYVGSGNPFLERALQTQRARRLADVAIEPPSFLATEGYAQAAAAGRWDLIVYDRCRPPTAGSPMPQGAAAASTGGMPRANTLFIGTLPFDGWEAESSVSAPPVLDTNRSHPLTHLIDLSNVLIAEARPLKPPPGAVALVTSPAGILMAVAPRGIYQDAVLAFEIAGEKGFGTDWPKKYSFPVFVLNVLEHLGGGRLAESRQSVIAGDPAVLPANLGGELTVVLPDGSRREVLPDALGTYRFAETDQLGLYRVMQQERTVGQFAVNVFGAAQGYDSAEGNVALRGEETAIRVGHTEIAGQRNLEPARREIWKLLVALTLAVLVAEWYIYMRRVWV